VIHDFKEDKNKQLKEVRNTVQDMDEKFSKELESKNTHMEILEMKT
jgi:hypothetical protein